MRSAEEVAYRQEIGRLGQWGQKHMLTGKTRTVARRALSSLRVWRLRKQGMTIGEGCRIASTTKLDQTNPRGIHIGANTVFSFHAAVLAHDYTNLRHVDTHIGSNCFIGAHAIVMPGVRIGDNVIVGAGSVVFTDVPSRSAVSGNPARVVERDIVTGRFGIRSQQFLASEGLWSGDPANNAERLPKVAPSRPAASAAPSRPAASAAELEERYFASVQMDMPFSDSDIDSFALIAMRAQIEQDEGITIPDAEWLEVETPKELLSLIVGKLGSPASPEDRPKSSSASANPASASRVFEITMPQMSRKGLSEAWLFKEMGDMHWSMITSALGVRSRDIANQDGDRLYATFTRISYDCTAPLSKFRENDPLVIEAKMSRFGSGIFMSRIESKSAEHVLSARMMSSFAHFGAERDNRSLMKGQPSIPDGFAIPEEKAMPEFVQQYRDVRANEISNACFSTEYEIVPVHDINGVGLLYFAAYPSIADICIGRYALAKGKVLFPKARDLYYFSNSGPDNNIDYHLTEWEEENDCVRTTAFLVRADGKRMAEIRTVYGQELPD